METPGSTKLCSEPQGLSASVHSGKLALYLSSEIPQLQPFRLTIPILLNFYTICAIVLLFFRSTYILLG